MENHLNDSKGCGTVMRVAPVAFLKKVNHFELGCKLGALTHSHPTAYLPAGCLVQIIALIKGGQTLYNAITETITILRSKYYHIETLRAVKKAVTYWEMKKPATYKTIEGLGQGWTAHEALSISLFCALTYENDFEKAVTLAVNHSGDSDSTGAITGNILGAYLGIDAIPPKWLAKLELKDTIENTGEELFKVVYDEEEDGE